MPSWPTRFHFGSSVPNNVEPPTLFSNQERPIRRRGPYSDVLREAGAPHNTSALGSSNLPTTSRPTSAFQHGRSVSQPLLHGIISSDIKDRRMRPNIRDDSEHRDDHSNIAPAISTTNFMDSTYNGSLHDGEIDFVNGKCATCDSSVRWPRQSDVFRCTICLMVNDLKPPFTGHQKDRNSSTSPSIHAEALSDQRKPKTVHHVSLSKTKTIIEDCIALYLKTCLGIFDGEPKDDSYKPFQESSYAADNQLNLSKPRTDQADRFSRKATQCRSSNTIQPFCSQDPSIRPTMHSTSLLADLQSSISQDRLTTSPRPVQQPPSRAPPPPPTAVVNEPSTKPSEMLGETSTDLSTVIFRPLENYIVACFAHCNILNASFPISAPSPLPRVASDANPKQSSQTSRFGKWNDDETSFSEIDAKTLLLGDFAENGMWWTGGADLEKPRGILKKADERIGLEKASNKTPRIHWGELSEWYYTILYAGRSWRQVLEEGQKNTSSNEINALNHISIEHQQQIEKALADACSHVQRTLLKASENLLRRPGVVIKRPEDGRFLLILFANPMLNSSNFGLLPKASRPENQRSMSHDPDLALKPVASSIRHAMSSPQKSHNIHHKNSSAHKNAGIVKRILGLISNLPDECHHHMIIWLSRSSESYFRRIVDLVGGFVTYRLSRQHGRRRSTSHNLLGELVPSISGSGVESPAQLHAALGIVRASKTPSSNDEPMTYSEDWQIKAAARVMSLLCTANNNSAHRQQDFPQKVISENGDLPVHPFTQNRTQPAQLLPTSTFYNSLLDFSDLVADFETWESRRGQFSFCQYPMFLSVWAKIHIMEYDARRQMETKAREAFFNSIMGRKVISQYLVLKIRRECLVEDSLRGVSEVVGAGQEEIKKGLRIEFWNEEGIDAGGLRKEWFLLLVREVFDPEHGLFIYDDDSQYCYFNPNSFETSDQFFLVGVVLGLAIYNSTILDVALPPFAFRKLLASAPAHNGPITSVTRPVISHSLDDLAEFQPSLAKGLRQLLEFEGDVETTFCRNFVAEIDRYGQVIQTPLCPDGENRPVTNGNRREFVDLYVHYLLDSAVSRQFEPFKRGFFTVCGGHALSLFRPDEIELLIRGSDEPLDVSKLRAAAVFDGWTKDCVAENEPVILWFWETFSDANAADQRKLLRFITSSDRIPATVNLVIKLTYLGDDIHRLPIARTCFNMLGLYRYPSKRILETKLWRAVEDSEGFGMK